MTNFISSPIEEYKAVIYGQSVEGDLVAFIHCFNNKKNIVTCEFYRDGSELPKNRNKGGRVGLTYHWSYFEEIISLLKIKSVFFGFIESTKVGYIATQNVKTGI